MQKDKSVNRGICLALAVFFLVPHGAVAAAAARANDASVVTGPELYKAMAARTDEDAAARGAVLKVLGRSEVRRVAARAGLDLKQAQAAVSTLSGEELRTVADQARRVDGALAGGSSVVITSTMVIIGLLVLILLLLVAR